jgi:hypothetical protein
MEREGTEQNAFKVLKNTGLEHITFEPPNPSVVLWASVCHTVYNQIQSQYQMITAEHSLHQ